MTSFLSGLSVSSLSTSQSLSLRRALGDKASTTHHMPAVIKPDANADLRSSSLPFPHDPCISPVVARSPHAPRARGNRHREIELPAAQGRYTSDEPIDGISRDPERPRVTADPLDHDASLLAHLETRHRIYLSHRKGGGAERGLGGNLGGWSAAPSHECPNIPQEK